MSPDYEIDLSTGAEEVTDQYDEQIEQMQQRLEEQAKRQATKHLKTHGREIKRLKKHAERALFANNKDQYIYAIGKLRTLYKQKQLPHSAMVTMFDTSRQQIVEMAKAFNAGANS
ncbi:hypothetical protein OFDDKENP_00121 [Aeromonas phage B614]|nr:hypothetical protein OFDDKENP_00121 [Aeromonas phage B614]UYD58515.1 hypothetical protein IPAKJDPM_00172 [Aeromonas phage avDM14-QBC]UYD58730.1 hypothetical protein HNNIDBEH_00137 [Aeromonas phage avDM10-HWA]UYD58966.1 hypothetical protein OFOPOMKI_00116 [Aeromonas phage avDM7-IJDJ]UYD59777.1 hypothetical protein LEHPIFIF_00004 [Aeromonas phage avDM9-HANS]